MTTKKLSLNYGTNVNYKLIKDGYKTVNGSFIVDNDTPKAMILDAPQEIYTLPNIIDINTETKSAPIIKLSDNLELPDGIICPEKEYILGEYGKEFFIPNNDHINNNNINVNNFNIVGSDVKLFNTTAMNFTSSSFIALKTPFKPGSNVWELVVKIKTPITMGTQDTLFGSYDSFYKTVGCELGTSGKIGVGITSNGSSWDISWLSGKTTLVANTWYWIKVSFTGSSYRYELSTDGKEYTLENSIDSSTPLYGADDSIMNFGKCGWRDDWWKGLIDLSETYIKINNEYFWKPECRNIVDAYDLVGSPTVSEDGVVSNISTSNYLSASGYLPSAIENVEFYARITPTQSSAVQCIYDNHWNIALTDMYPRIWCGSAIRGSTQLSANIEYDIKVTVDSNWNTCFYYKEVNDTEWTLATSGTINASGYLPGAQMFLGIHAENNTEPFLGTIDLKHTYIKVDGKDWWKARFKNIFINGDFLLYGSPRLVNEDMMTVFWENFYIKSLYPITQDSELFFEFRTEKDVQALQNIFFVRGSGSNTIGPELYITNGQLRIWNNSNSSDVTLLPVEMCKTYKFKETLHGSGATIVIYDENDIILYENSFDNLGFSYDTTSLANIGTHSGSSRYFRGRLNLKTSYIKNNNIINNIAKQAGKYIGGILNSSIKDVSEEKTYNLYDIQTDVRSLILSEDKNINVDNIEFIEYCGQVTIPSHTVYEYDTANSIWSNLPVTINYNIPEGATITINENTVTSSPYITDEIGEIIYKVNKEGYEEYIGQIDYAFGGSTYEITITEDDMISNSSSEGPSISPDTPSLTRQYYAFTPIDNAFLTSANANGNVNGDTSTFYATSEEVGTHQILYMLNTETGNMIEITNVELTITSSDLIVYPLTTGPLFFTPPKQTDAVRNSTKDIVAKATPEASTTATIINNSTIA